MTVAAFDRLTGIGRLGSSGAGVLCLCTADFQPPRPGLSVPGAGKMEPVRCSGAAEVGLAPAQVEKMAPGHARNWQPGPRAAGEAKASEMEQKLTMLGMRKSLPGWH